MIENVVPNNNKLGSNNQNVVVTNQRKDNWMALSVLFEIPSMPVVFLDGKVVGTENQVSSMQKRIWDQITVYDTYCFFISQKL